MWQYFHVLYKYILDVCRQHNDCYVWNTKLLNPWEVGFLELKQLIQSEDHYFIPKEPNKAQ